MAGRARLAARFGVNGPLSEGLTALRYAGRKALVPYVMAGLERVDAAFLRSLESAGADAIEVGIPFSDPVMDGPVIQEASRRALQAGATPAMALDLVRSATLGVPTAIMTYLNPVLAHGPARFAADAVIAGVAGIIVPDLPVDEANEWLEVCAVTALEPIFLAAPNSSPERLRRVAAASKGFVYCVSTYGVTGSRDRLAGSAREVVEALRRLTDTSLIVGVGISTPEQARAACLFADGVVVGTALVRPVLEGRPGDALRLAAEIREAIDAQ